ncbi:single-stranded DNA-binding protein [Gemmatimonas groenlandica]|uniref:Single-stranded DNA-binding protein n=1 Tax=Gemmatimonas groenlandica TaxID=2732249 RepID=A0A6M4IPM3_9BACT|nr:single-stranded DNA-binding protein [Gemmatimonas groenlandica]QJR34842.1 single-stranded DNA-binding protein [Gemmatimonas groenlandica]
MSRSLNKAILIGNVGSDPEIRTVGTGTRVAQFSLATSRNWTDQSGAKQEKTEWHRCVVWNSARGSGLADVVEKYVKKGEKIYVEGEIEYRQWQDKDGQTRYTTEIKVKELMLLGGRAGGGGGDDMDSAPRRSAAPAARPKTAAAPSAGKEEFGDFPGALEDEDDDLPF